MWVFCYYKTPAIFTAAIIQAQAGSSNTSPWILLSQSSENGRIHMFQ